MSRKKIPKPSEILVASLYFREEGAKQTRRTLEAAARRARELGIQNVVVASTSGATGLLAAQMIPVRNLVVVSHSTGFARPGYQEMKPRAQKQLAAAGAKLLTCQHAFGGVGRAVRKRLGTYELEELIAYTLRIFGEGTKVAVEVALMAADAGLLPAAEPCIAIGGSSQGADTALLLRPANAQNFFDLRIMEIIAKPRFEKKP
jgi:hypothetical protein